MEVIKRNGQREHFDWSKVMKVIEFAIQDQQMKDEFLRDLELNLKNGISTKEIQNVLIKLAHDKISAQTPDWQFVASKFLAYDLYKESGINRSYTRFGYGSFYDLISRLTCLGLYTKEIMGRYTIQEIRELESYISDDRDELLTYAGLHVLSKRYLARNFEKGIMELPQERFMIVSMFLGLNEPEENRMRFVKVYYDYLSQHGFMTATPTLLNSGKEMSQLSSCFIMDVDDDLWSIMDVGSIAAQLSKFAGGIGIYTGRIRPRGSSIRNHKEASNGVTPWAKIYENVAMSCNQLGARAGAINLNHDIDSIDVEEFLEWRTEGGDDRIKVHKIHHTLVIPDLFMKQVEARGKWYLLDKHDIEVHLGYRLEEFFGDEYERRYWEAVKDSRIRKKEVEAVKLFAKFLRTVFEQGEPYVFFRDIAHRFNANSHAGAAYATNLCTEIIQNLKHAKLIGEELDWDSGILKPIKQLGETVVCNLASIHGGKIPIDEAEEDAYLEELTYWMVRGLDNVIDLNFYPTRDAEWTNKRYRAIGVGFMSLHEYFAVRGVAWESEERLALEDRLFEKIAFYVIKASNRLAIERGAYALFEGSDWATGEYFVKKGYVARDEHGNIVAIKGKEKWFELCLNVMKYGIRNGYLMAIAPTGTISIIANATASTDPIFNRVYTEGKGDSAVKVAVPSLRASTYWLFKEAHNIDQIWSVRGQAVRQKHIDQGNSFNVYIRADQPNIAKYLYDIYMNGWKSGVKTFYYVRTRTLTVEECESCQ